MLMGVPVARRSMCTRKDVQRAALAFAKEHEDIEMYNTAESQARAQPAAPFFGRGACAGSDPGGLVE